MSRACGWCTSTHRAEWERRVLDGESIHSVALDGPFGATAGHRHFRNHVAQLAVDVVRRAEASQLGVASFASRVLALADSAAAIRERAARTGNPRIALMASKEEREALGVLGNRLGIDGDEVIEQLHSARALATAISAVVQNYPAIAQELADHLSAADQEDLAEAFGRLAERANARQLQPLPTLREIAG